MMNNLSVLADSISHIEHLKAFENLIKNRFSKIQLDQLLVYLIDTVNGSAIPFLAEQFDVLGYKGFRLAKTDKDRREIIKKSIQLHRYKGTLWAIKEAIKSIGYGHAVVTEHVSGHWANFRVDIDLGERSLLETEVRDLQKMVLEYKNARSHLVDITYSILIGGDEITIQDAQQDFQSMSDTDSIFIGSDFRHDGRTIRNGSRNYSLDADTLNITIHLG